MRESSMVVLLLSLAFVSAVAMTTYVNLTNNEKVIEQREKDREAYLQCLRANEKLIEKRPQGVNMIYCGK
jgi:hypothetical protein